MFSREISFLNNAVAETDLRCAGLEELPGNSRHGKEINGHGQSERNLRPGEEEEDEEEEKSAERTNGKRELMKRLEKKKDSLSTKKKKTRLKRRNRELKMVLFCCFIVFLFSFVLQSVR